MVLSTIVRRVFSVDDGRRKKEGQSRRSHCVYHDIGGDEKLILKENKISSEDHRLDYYRDLDFSPTRFSRLASTPLPMGSTCAVANCASISPRRSCLLVYRRWAEML